MPTVPLPHKADKAHIFGKAGVEQSVQARYAPWRFDVALPPESRDTLNRAATSVQRFAEQARGLMSMEPKCFSMR